MQKEVQINHLTPDVARWENEGGAPSQPKSDQAISWRTGNQLNDRRWYLRDRSCSRPHIGAPVVNKTWLTHGDFSRFGYSRGSWGTGGEAMVREFPGPHCDSRKIRRTYSRAL